MSFVHLNLVLARLSRLSFEISLPGKLSPFISAGKTAGNVYLCL